MRGKRRGFLIGFLLLLAFLLFSEGFSYADDLETCLDLLEQTTNELENEQSLRHEAEILLAESQSMVSELQSKIAERDQSLTETETTLQSMVEENRRLKTDRWLWGGAGLLLGVVTTTILVIFGG